MLFIDLIDEYVAKLVEVGPRLDPDAALVDGAFWRRLLLALIADYWPARFGELPRYVDDDPDDDKVVHTALVTSADWLVSDDAHIVPDAAESIEYQLPDQTARIAAARFDYYVAEQVETDGLDLSDIDGSWLWSLLRPLDHEA